MARYLVTVSYTAEGAKGVLKDGGSKRKSVAEAAVKSVGGRIESFYFALGADDAYLIVDAPDHAAVVAVSLAINSTGAVKTRTTVLLTPEEVDQAAKKQISYKPPGS